MMCGEAGRGGGAATHPGWCQRRIRPSEFVCIIGANGAQVYADEHQGRAGAGERGMVLFNGVDLHANFQALKQVSPSCRSKASAWTAHVARSTRLHGAASVASRYHLEQRRAAVDGRRAASIYSTGLNSASDAQRRTEKVRELSERDSQPSSVLFLDEVTSGLDESTDGTSCDCCAPRRRGDDHCRGHPFLGERGGVL